MTTDALLRRPNLRSCTSPSCSSNNIDASYVRLMKNVTESHRQYNLPACIYIFFSFFSQRAAAIAKLKALQRECNECATDYNSVMEVLDEYKRKKTQTSCNPSHTKDMRKLPTASLAMVTVITLEQRNNIDLLIELAETHAHKGNNVFSAQCYEAAAELETVLYRKGKLYKKAADQHKKTHATHQEEQCCLLAAEYYEEANFFEEPGDLYLRAKEPGLAAYCFFYAAQFQRDNSKTKPIYLEKAAEAALCFADKTTKIKRQKALLFVKKCLTEASAYKNEKKSFYRPAYPFYETWYSS